MKKAQLLHLSDNMALRFLPEGPYPFNERQFSWVAIQHGSDSNVGSVNLFDWTTKTNQSFPLPGRPGFAFGTDRGNLVVGCERNVVLFDPRTGLIRQLIDGVDSHTSGTIINDGIAWQDNLIFGTKDLEFKTKKAGLYFWRGRDRKLFLLRSDQICSNGKCILPIDDQHIALLDIDTPTKKVVQYTINTESGAIEQEKIVADLADDIAFPDGMTASLDGESVWISMYNPNPAPFGRTIQVDLESGAIVDEVLTPDSPQATCPQWFVFEDQLFLVITTAIEHMSSDRLRESSSAGALYFYPMGPVTNMSAYHRLTPKFTEVD